MKLMCFKEVHDNDRIEKKFKRVQPLKNRL